MSAASTPGRRWTLEAARALLPDIQKRTAEAHGEMEAIQRERRQASGNVAREPELESRASEVLSRWLRAMEALGVEVRGPWLVDFDNGRGYYCWRFPEERLEHFHGYDEGFGGRVRIQ